MRRILAGVLLLAWAISCLAAQYMAGSAWLRNKPTQAGALTRRAEDANPMTCGSNGEFVLFGALSTSTTGIIDSLEDLVTDAEETAETVPDAVPDGGQFFQRAAGFGVIADEPGLRGN